MQTRATKYSLLVFACLIAGQLACVGRLTPSSNSGTASSPSPNQTALVDQIFDRYTQAIGGQEAVDRITSYKTKGTFALGRMRGSMEVWGKNPDKNLTIIEFPQLGTLKKGFDGEARWVQTPAGTVTDSNEQEIADVERDAEVYRAGKIKSLYESVKLDSKARLSGRDVYVIEGEQKKGPAEKLFFDVENGLLVRWDMARRHPKRGTVFVKVHLNDYREVSGVKVPFNIRFGFESFSFTITLDELQHNIPIDDSMFRKPGS